MDASVANLTLNGEGDSPTSTDLWSSILNSVRTDSRSVTTKNVIILGSTKAGKSTLISRLAHPTGEASSAETNPEGVPLDLGLGYTVLDIGDGDETTARLGIHQLPSSLPPYPSLLPLAISAPTLLDSLVVIVLDWNRPWLFLKELKGWMGILEGTLKGSAGDGWEGAESRERLEAHLRHYFEPAPAKSTATSIAAGSSASQMVDLEAPLPPGVLTTNLGIPIVIVCTKADQMNTLERDKDFKEEQFDYVQQTLRTIALKYGASLFFTSHSRPTSFAKLRAYILHRLYSRPTSAHPILPSTLTTDQSTNGAPSNLANQTTSTSNAFPFPYRANVVDRDQVLVPAGWDSWGKIRILRDRFEAEVVGNGWDSDMESERRRIRGDVETSGEVGSVSGKVVGAQTMYEDFIVDLDEDDSSANRSEGTVVLEDEQAFFKVHYNAIQAEKASDPRNAFARQSSSSKIGMDDRGAPNGPTRSNSTIEGVSRSSRQESSSGRPLMSPALHGTPDSKSNPLFPSTPANATPSAGESNEVLANFFSSLLAARGSTPAGAIGSSKLANVGGVQALSRSMSGDGKKGDATREEGERK